MIRKIYRESSLKWFENEPELITLLYNEITQENVSPTFDTHTNQKRIQSIQQWWKENLSTLLQSLSNKERITLDIVMKNFGWLVYDNLDNLIRFTSTIFRIPREDLIEGIQGLCQKQFLFNYEPLKYHPFLFLSPFVEIQTSLNTIDNTTIADQLYNRVPYVIGLIGYLIANAPRSSEANEIHRVDLQKLQNFFTHSPLSSQLENLLKNLSRIGLIQKYNNRIIIQRSIIQKLEKIPLSSLFSLSFLYETFENIGLHKNAFLTLQWLAFTKNEELSIREVFYYYTQHILSSLYRDNFKSFKLFLQNLEQDFYLFLKHLEKQGIITIQRSRPSIISRDDTLCLNPLYRALLQNADFTPFFDKQHFIVEANGEVIVDPDLHPHIHLNLIFMAQPKEIQTLSIYQITKKSIYKALAYGYTIEEVITFLEKHSLHPISPQLIQTIRDYGKNFTQPNANNCHILQFSSTESSIIADHFAQESIEIEPHTFLFFDDTSYKQVKEFCEKQGITFKENINFLHQNIVSYPNSIDHHIKHLQHFLDILESRAIVLPHQDVLKIRLLSPHDFSLLMKEKSPER